MEFNQIIQTVDMHTAGEPLRIITSGVPVLPGDSILAKRQYMLDHYDHIRQLLMQEPRGHTDMYGCVLTEPVSEQAATGVLFMHNEGYSTICGHAAIAIGKWLVGNGQVPAEMPVTTVGLDVPAGFVQLQVAVEQLDPPVVSSVSFVNVPSFLYKEGLSLDIPGHQGIMVDIVYGGAFYAMVDAQQLGTRVLTANAQALIHLGMDIKHAVEDQVDVVHPTSPGLKGIYGTIICDEPVSPGADGRNVTIFADGQIDRSPCGSGTSARLAAMYAKGQIEMEQSFVHESIIGTTFTGQVVSETQVDNFDAAMCKVTGDAFVTGTSQFMLDPRDPLGNGFLLG